MGSVLTIIDVYSFFPVGSFEENNYFSFKYLFIVGYDDKYNAMIIH